MADRAEELVTETIERFDEELKKLSPEERVQACQRLMEEAEISLFAAKEEQ